MKIFQFAYLCKKHLSLPKNFPPFYVNCEHEQMWLLFLKQHNQRYQDVNINTETLSQLPNNGNVLDHIPVIVDIRKHKQSDSSNDDNNNKQFAALQEKGNNTNNESDNNNNKDRHGNDCKMRYGPEQGRATDQYQNERDTVLDYCPLPLNNFQTDPSEDIATFL